MLLRSHIAQTMEKYIEKELKLNLEYVRYLPSTEERLNKYFPNHIVWVIQEVTTKKTFRVHFSLETETVVRHYQYK